MPSASLAHKIKLLPTLEQEVYFRQAAGVARKTYNVALAAWNSTYEAEGRVSCGALKKAFNSTYKAEFPYMTEVHRDCHSQPFKNLQTAWTNYFRSLRDPSLPKVERPTFKCKGRSKDSFYVANDKFSVSGKFIKLPKVGVVKLAEELRFVGKIMSATVSRQADCWSISISMIVENAERTQDLKQESVGVDLGVTTALTLSGGIKIDSPRPLKRYLSRIKRQSRSFSRKQKDGKNREKARLKLAKTYKKITDIRSDFTHKVTTKLCRENQTVVIEDLNVKSMHQSACSGMSRAISDVGFFEIRRQLTYKAKLFGTNLVVADRWFPSSKICSSCGIKNTTLGRGDKRWVCPSCGSYHDRDVNASENLNRYPAWAALRS